MNDARLSTQYLNFSFKILIWQLLNTQTIEIDSWNLFEFRRGYFIYAGCFIFQQESCKKQHKLTWKQITGTSAGWFPSCHAQIPLPHSVVWSAPPLAHGWSRVWHSAAPVERAWSSSASHQWKLPNPTSLKKLWRSLQVWKHSSIPGCPELQCRTGLWTATGLALRWWLVQP